MKKLFFYTFVFTTIFKMHSQERFSVFFESNKFELNALQTQNLKEWIVNNTNSKIVAIDGFTDEDGSNGFNDTLAKRRVDFIYNFVNNKVKIRDDFKSRSYGETQQSSANKSENRKVTIYFISQNDIPRENEILGLPTEIPIEKPKPPIDFPQKIVIQNPNGTKSEFQLDIAFMKTLNNAKAGEKLKVENLNFQVNTFVIVPESRAKLYELLLVMQNNPDLKIDIHGHLCCMPNDRLNLSTQRAKAIYGFLVANNIPKNRLSYQGFGSTKAIYAIPEKDESERAANRRVEIEIIAN